MSDQSEREWIFLNDLLRRAHQKLITVSSGYSVGYKTKDDPVTSADIALNEFLTEEIHSAFPSDSILAEESCDGNLRLSNRRLWCVDPIDGTQEFIAGNGEFAIMVGLAVDGVAVLGGISVGLQGELFLGGRGFHAWHELNGKRTRIEDRPVRAPDAITAVVSRSHLSPATDAALAACNVINRIPCGSVGVKIARILAGQADVYLHMSRGTKQWDTCAPEAILNAAGGKLSDCFGRPYLYNRSQVENTDGILATHGADHGELIRGIAPWARTALGTTDPPKH